MYQRILVPLERETGPEAHVRHAAKLAKEEDAQLTLLRVITVVPSEDYFTKKVQVEAGSAASKGKEAAETYVDSLARELTAEGVRAQPRVIVSDLAEDEAIVAHAAEMGDDLIVLPRQRRSLLSRWLQGNVMAKVQRRSSVPVLTVGEEM